MADVPSAPVPRRSWFGRNWAWLVPLGVLVVCGGCCGFIGLAITGAMALIKNSHPYQEAVERAKTNPELQEAIGVPMEESLFVQGEVNTSGDSGSANLTIPLKGPKGSATISVQAMQTRGVWSYTRMQATVDGSGKTIDLTKPGDVPAKD